MKLSNKVSIIALAFFLMSKGAFCAPFFNQDALSSKPTAILQALNKVTGKTSVLEIEVGGEAANFGKLTIKVVKCWRSPPDQSPENKILLEIKESDSNQNLFGKSVSDAVDQKIIFYGWMFSSSPSISGLEHPIYDITALECNTDLGLTQIHHEKIVYFDFLMTDLGFAFFLV